MSKRVANRSGPSRNKAGRNSFRKKLRLDISKARAAEDESWFIRLVNKLVGVSKTPTGKRSLAKGL